MNLGATFAIAVGLGMIGQWIYFLVKGEVAETRTSPVELGFHLLAEFVTAIALIIGGIILFMGMRWGLAVYLLAAGALLYSATNSAGYFAQRRNWSFVLVFGVILLLTLLSVVAVFSTLG